MALVHQGIMKKTNVGDHQEDAKQIKCTLKGNNFGYTEALENIQTPFTASAVFMC